MTIFTKGRTHAALLCALAVALCAPLASPGAALASGTSEAHDSYGYPYPNAPDCDEYSGANCVADAWQFYQGQCTSWAAYRLNDRSGVTFNNSYGGVHWGNAENWGNAARAAGIAVNGTPAVGAIAWYSSGHVGYVEQVNSATSVVISEMNRDLHNSFDLTTITTSSRWPSGFIHFKDLASGPPSLHDGDFISVTGSSNVYRIAGGAPIFVSSWSHVGGSHSVTKISSSQFNGLRDQPADGTYLQGWDGGAVFVTAGGAPLPISDWSHVGGSSGKAVVHVDRTAIDNAGEGSGVWSHLNDVPADGTFVKAYGNATIYRVAGGAPLAISSPTVLNALMPSGGKVTSIDAAVLANAGTSSGVWSHMRDVPADGSFIKGYGHDAIYRIAGGAPLAISSPTALNSLLPSGGHVTTVDQAALDRAGSGAGWNHLRFYPADGTFVSTRPGGQVFVIAGGAPIYVSSWDSVGGSAGKSTTAIDAEAIDRAGAAGGWKHLLPSPLDGTFLRAGPGGGLYETRGGAPYPITALPSAGVATVVSAAAIANAGQPGVWRFLKAPAPPSSPETGGPGAGSPGAAAAASHPRASAAGRHHLARISRARLVGRTLVLRGSGKGRVRVLIQSCATIRGHRGGRSGSKPSKCRTSASLAGRAKHRGPLKLKLPRNLRPGRYRIVVTVKSAGGRSRRAFPNVSVG